MMSSVEAPIIWSIINGSELIKNVPPLKAVTGTEIHIRTKAGVLQRNCSIVNVSIMVKFVISVKKLPTVIARYRPSRESLIHPVTGKSADSATYA